MKNQAESKNELVKENLTFSKQEIIPIIIIQNQSKWQVKTNFAEADFWLINKASQEKLGQPVKEFETYLTGIKCPDYIFPNYGYYLCQYFYQMGMWKQYALGTTNLKHLRVKDVKSVLNSLINTVQLSS